MQTIRQVLQSNDYEYFRTQCQIADSGKQREITPSYYLNRNIITANIKKFIDENELQQKIKGSFLGTLEKMLDLYVMHINEDRDKYPIDRLPGLHTTKASIAKTRNQTSRTILNHLNRLQDVGIISHKLITSPGLELFFHPAIIFSNQPRKGLAYRIKLESMSFFSPFNYSWNLIYNTSNVHKWKSGIELAEELGVAPQQVALKGKLDQELDHQGLQVQGQKSKKNGPEVSNKTGTNVARGGGGPIEGDSADQGEVEKASRQADPVEKKASAGAGKVANSESELTKITFLNSLVSEFVEQLLTVLYISFAYSEKRKKELFEIVKTEYFNNFRADLTREEYTDYYLELCKRIDIVSKYLDNNPTYQLPRPSVFLTHEKGFKVTAKWLANSIRTKILRGITYEMKVYNKGKGKYRHKDRISMFVMHKKRVSRYRDTVLYNKFLELHHLYRK